VTIAVGSRRPSRPAAWEGAAPSRILVAEDEPRIASLLERGLAASGFTTEVAESGDEALALARSGRFDLVILDVGLPRMDGLEVLRELRQASETIPVVILTARGSMKDTVAGLEGGADDYITKPFRFEELLACVRLCLRGERTIDATGTISVGDMSLDLRAKRAIVDGVEIDLTAREFAMAEAFFRHAGQVLSTAQLLDAVWGLDFDPGSNFVGVYVGYLRRKLGKDRISTVRGLGYRLENDARITAA
jgi:DNA-binding response OmpR family regulator